ncbi:MAG: 5-bromo-4-chloroindolyl phosphate hydrolysis family protein [Rhodobacter sp.]|nr:5-bromo-4-chloroindolyl phosphate hydrolysis family protein [Rhodobacter sp.]
MAQRYGGQFSPEGKTDNARPAPKSPFDGARRTRAGGRVNLLFFAPFPLIWRAFRAEPAQMAQFLVAFGVLILAAWLTREGVKAHEAYDARKIAKRPALPRKLLAAALTGLGLAIVGIAGHGPLAAAIFAVLGAALHVFAFGPDPLTDKGAEGIDSFQSDRVARAVDEAEKHLRAMTDAAQRAQDRGIIARVEQFQATVRNMFRTIEDDPRDLTPARKYLSVYLMGARDATVKFADLYARTREAKVKSDYTGLLDDLEANFAARTEKLLNDNRTDLDIEIGVLRDRLAREGVTTSSVE